MKRVLMITTFSCLFLLMNSCIILYPFYGIKKKTDETIEVQKEYLLDKGFDTLNLYRKSCAYADSLSHKKYALNTYKIAHNGRAAAVQIRMYDTTGKLLYGWEQCFGNAEKLAIFDSVPMKGRPWLPVNFNLSLETDLNLFDIDANEKQRLIEESKNHDYTIILMWAAWTGRFNSQAFKLLYEYIERNNLDLYLLKLNTATICDTVAVE